MKRPGLGWLLAIALRLHPARFRARFGDDLEATFHAGYEAARAHGRVAAFDFARRNFPSLFWNAAVLRFQDRRHVHRERPTPGDTMGSFLLDLRFGVRSLSHRQRALAVLTISALAVGIGITTAIVSVVRGVLLEPLPYDTPERVVRMYGMNARGDSFGTLSGPNVAAYREHLESFETLAAFNDYAASGIDLVLDGSAERLRMLKVSAGYFETLGVRPSLGRTFIPDEEIPPGAAVRDAGRFEMVTAPATPIAVISHRLWQHVLEGDPNAVGATLRLDGEAFEVVGIMPSRFVDLVDPSIDLWLPLDTAPGGLNVRFNSYLSAIGRLREGVDLANAQAELTALSARRAAMFPDSNEGVSARLVPLSEDVVGGVRWMLMILLGAGFLVLLVCAVNVANLFLVRGLGRRQELALRAALGAGRWRLFASALGESLVAAGLGGIGGLGVAYVALRALLRLRPDALPRHDAIGLDAWSLGFALVVTLGTSLVFASVAGLRAGRSGASLGAQAMSATGFGDLRARRAQNAMVVAQVALAIILLVGGGLLMRSFAALNAVELGFDPDHVQTFKVRLPDHRYGDPRKRIDFYQSMHDRLEAIPAVRASGATSKLPTSGRRNQWGFGIQGRPRGTDDPPRTAQIRCVDGNLFAALDIALLRGRLLTAADRADRRPVVVINQALARRDFPHDDALGAELNVGGETRTVVGVIADTRLAHREAAPPQIFIPHGQFAADRNWDLSFVVAFDPARGDAAAAEADIRQVVGDLDPHLAIYDVQTMRQVASRDIADARFATVLMSVFAAFGLFLASIGIYGALAYVVRHRTGEIGLRMALGAARGNVLALVARQALTVTAAGLVLGLVGALALSRFLESLLFEVESADPATLGATSALLLIVAIAAIAIPARRAASVDPAKVLRSE